MDEQHDDSVGPCVSSQEESHNDGSLHEAETGLTEVLVVDAEPLGDEPNANINTNSDGDELPRMRHYWCWRQRYRMFQIPLPSFGSNNMANDAWSCTVVILTFWLFASMILMLGFYGSYNLQLGPNCSYAIGANPLFAHSIQAREVDDHATGPILYGFHKSPSLDVVTTWSKTHNVSIEPGFHRDWPYYLNAGSRVDIYYNLTSSSSDSLSIVIAQGREALVRWMDDPSNPYTTLSWNYKFGSGRITQDITEYGVYYIAVGNLNLNAVEVYLNITVQSRHYNTSNADIECYLSNSACSFKLKLLSPNVAVLTTPNTKQVSSDSDFYFQVSFGIQWFTYFTGSCIVTALIFAMFRWCDKSQPDITYDTANQGSESVTEREPLISPKSGRSSGMGSSYDELISIDEDDMEEDNVYAGGLEAKFSKDGGSNSKKGGLCAICFDAPKDCFFIPCGHSAACFTCGSRIAEEAGICPICRRKMKKVRKIFLV